MRESKLILFGFHAWNGVLMVFSLGIASLGSYLTQTTVRKRFTAAFMFVSAFAIIFITLNGVFAVAKKIIKAILAYVISTILLVVTTIAFGVVLFIAASDKYVIESTKRDIEKVFALYDVEVRKTKFIDKYQEKHRCCGINHPSDWLQKLDYVPSSCCDELHDNACNEVLAYQKSCQKVWLQRSKFIFRLSAAMLWVGAIIGIMCALLAFVLWKRFRLKQSKGKLAIDESDESVASARAK